MILGSGMIASCLASSSIKHDGLIIFACGVSNSSETRTQEYERELELLSTYLGTDKKLVYFSSTSVVSGRISNYTVHKLNVERYIEEKFKDN